MNQDLAKAKRLIEEGVAILDHLLGTAPKTTTASPSGIAPAWRDKGVRYFRNDKDWECCEVLDKDYLEEQARILIVALGTDQDTIDDITAFLKWNRQGRATVGGRSGIKRYGGAHNDALGRMPDLVRPVSPVSNFTPENLDEVPF